MSDARAIRRWCGGAALGCLAAMAAALMTPVHLHEAGEDSGAPGLLPSGAAESAPEDLHAFLANRRWGVSLLEVWEAEAAKARPAAPAATPEPAENPERAINPALAKMGFVGLIVSKDQSAVLLASPAGGVARFVPGDILPDGRVLVSVADNRMTLRGENLPEEVLWLFPRVGSDPLADSRGGNAGGSRSTE